MRCLFLIAVVTFSGLVSGQRERDNTIQECFSKVADVFFILDSSSSIYIEDYYQVLNFVSQVVTRFDISSDDTRIGALTFSDDYQVGFDLQRFRSKDEVLVNIDNRTLPYRTGVTNTDQAIRYVRENVSFRPDITKVMVVITDGGSRSPGATLREADLARDAGFHMVVVGVGQYLDAQEWRAIASNPDNDYVFNITNFNFLSSLRDSLPRRICLMPPIVIGGECRVNEAADVMFLAAPNGVNTAIDVMEDLAERFEATNRLRVRYVMGSCRAEVDRGFQGPEVYCERLSGSPDQADDTFVNLVGEMREAATALRAERNANQVAVLFIDDQSMRDDRFSILQEVRNAAQFDNIEIIVVDLGVRDFSNFVSGMTQNRDNVIDYDVRRSELTIRRVLDRVCASVNVDFGIINPSK